LCGLLQANDSLYPTGSYAHSFGLEGLVQQGVVVDRASLRAFLLQSVLGTLEHAELPVVWHAWHFLERRDWAALGRLCELASALKSTRETRLASENVGRQRAELAALLHPASLAVEFCRRAREEHWPSAATVSAAVEAFAIGAPAEAALASYTYAALAGLIAAAMKLLRLGQNGAQSLLTEVLAQAPALLQRASATPLEETGWFNPWFDIASAHHEHADARMFMS
jgi:urease accessory protein